MFSFAVSIAAPNEFVLMFLLVLSNVYILTITPRSKVCATTVE